MIWYPSYNEAFCVNSSETGQVVLTLDSTLAIQFGAEHSQPEDQHHKRKDYPNGEADTPDRRKMILSGDRKYDEEYRTSQWTTELSRMKLWIKV